jgi:(Z)-2-((N-methylformamido)methylene)-5-hydroxybutyrolactone dehydrogenase
MVLNAKASLIAGSRHNLYINGRSRAPASGKYAQSWDPTTGEPWYEFALADVSDVDLAVSAAGGALRNPRWSRLTASERGQLVRRLGQLVGENADALAEIETRDNGKLLRESKAQISVLAEQYSYFGGAADKLEGSTIPVNRRDVLNYTTREPLGIVGIIVPWNSPLYQLSWTLGPALACGNSVVIKPSEHTTASTLALAELVEAAGFPDGVFNVITGYGSEAGYALTRHPDIAKIAFTGSTATGRKVAQNAAIHLAQTNLELGGKSPNCIFADADLDRAINGVIAGIFAAAGQTCVAGSRIYVQASIYDEVIDRLSTKARSIRIGDPTDPQTQLGPLAISAQLTKVEDYVRIGQSEGARLVSGGRRPESEALGRGFFFEPTLFAGARNDMRLVREEIFGPVGAIIPFEDDAQLVELANDNPYGLTAGIWTRDIDRALRFARDIEAGTIWVNTYRAAAYSSPMGGFKASGYGKHYGLESLREYSRLKNVMIDYSGQTQDAFVMRVKG